MFTIEQIMLIRSQLINVLNHSGLTIETALLLVKDVYNELYVAALQRQMAEGNGARQFTEEETVNITDIDKEEVKEENGHDENND